jgi:serine/threonine protein kinase
MDLTPCPSPDQLEQLLNEHLDGLAYEKVSAHVAGCATCQRVLEKLTAATNVLGAAFPPAEPPTDPGLTERLLQAPLLASWADQKGNAEDTDAADDRRSRPEEFGGSDPRESVASASSAFPSKPAEPWPALPGYEILGVLGRGGAAIVYKARHLALNRIVALKMIRAVHQAGAEELIRFRLEAEMLARLRHPNIVQVYEVGAWEGQPYISLEFVDGGTLATRLAGRPLPAARAAALAETLALAVHAAHQAGIVHRDLKPANILLASVVRGPSSVAQEQDAVPDNGQRTTDNGLIPKISDFGLARHLHVRIGLTQTGRVLGTPSYMAPEQARGLVREIGPATDIYALGAILYQLLTGRPPFQGAKPIDILLQVVHEEPVPPRRLAPQVSRDLEAICLKCLRREPGDRYISARQLAEDLRRFLDGKPVQVRSAPAWERGCKWVRRRPALATLLAVAAAAGPVLLVSGLRYHEQLRAAVQTARTAEQEAGAKAQAAVQQRDLALRALGQLVSAVQDKLGDFPAAGPLRQSLLDTAIEGLKGLTASTATAAPDLGRAAAHQQMGDIFLQAGRMGEAHQQYELCRQIAAEMVAAEPANGAAKRYLAGACERLGGMSLNRGEPAAARAFFTQMVELAEAWAAAEPVSAEARWSLAQGYERLGQATLTMRDWHTARDCYRKLQSLARAWAVAEPASAEAKYFAVTSYEKLAALAGESGDRLTARDYCRKALEIWIALAAADPRNRAYRRNLMATLDHLGAVGLDLDDVEAAREPIQSAHRLAKHVADADPENLQAQCDLVDTCYDCGQIEQTALRFAGALPWYNQAQDVLRRLEARGKLADRPLNSRERLEQVQKAIVLCTESLRAVMELSFALTQPARMAHELLLARFRVLMSRARYGEAAETAETLCRLTRSDADDLYDLARTCLLCGTSIAPGKKPAELTREEQAIRQRCTERAVEALAQAVEQGYTDVGRLQADGAFTLIRKHAGYQAVIDRLRR